MLKYSTFKFNFPVFAKHALKYVQTSHQNVPSQNVLMTKHSSTKRPITKRPITKRPIAKRAYDKTFFLKTFILSTNDNSNFLIVIKKVGDLS